MEAKILFYLLLITFTPRHLQNSDAPVAKLLFHPGRLKLFVKDESLHCRLRLNRIDIYKSYYCFSKIKKKEGLKKPSWVITSSKKIKKNIHSTNTTEVVIFSSMANWKSFYFTKLSKGT